MEYSSADTLFSDPEVLSFLEDTFSAVPQHNIISEFRFGRMQQFVRSCCAKVPAASTVFAKHVLQEVSLNHDRSVKDLKDSDAGVRAAAGIMNAKNEPKVAVKAGAILTSLRGQDDS